MKIDIILKPLLIVVILISGCKKEEQACVKEENYFEAEFDDQTIEPHYAQGGGFGLYTFYAERCLNNENNWLLSVTTENNLNLYLNLVDVTNTGMFHIEMGDSNHLALDCDDVNSIYLTDHTSNSLVFISSNNGQVKITEYDNNYGILVGTFTCEMVSTVDPSIKKTITGEFNLNKSTLDNTKRPCWL